MATLTELESYQTIARFSRERADYVSKQVISQSTHEREAFAAHVKTLDELLSKLSDPVKQTSP